MTAVMSVLGLYNYDGSIFNNMSYPTGFTSDDKTDFVDNLLMELAELEVIYPNPDFMKLAIQKWSAKEVPTWNRIYTAAQLEYNPIENYRRNETETIEDDRTEEHSGSDVNTASGSDALTKTGQDSLEASSTVNEEAGGDDRTDNNITGFDSYTLVPQSEQETYYGKTIETGTEAEQTTTYGTTDTQTYGKTDTFRHGEKIEHGGTTERTVLAYGNIGVTTSQEMLTQEMEVAKIINVMNIIIESFKNRFCLMVY